MENSRTFIDHGFEEVEIKPEFLEADGYLVSFVWLLCYHVDNYADKVIIMKIKLPDVLRPTELQTNE